ncbi:thioredoxin reductase gliT [Aspergillus lucknowensis]|uniref:Pyridine nucleotide-disulfide oxidoreductase n=1 Tax=Aspergillus lucknowensis TaxID=176173 RepID=A0ABR4LDM9_9EURO
METSKVYDVLIVGGGPAGLAAATTLVRQLHTVLIIDSGEYRNAAAQRMHLVPGFDHQDPAVFRAKIRADLETRYSDFVDFRSAKVIKAAGVEGKNHGFELTDDRGKVYKSRTVILANGVRDKVEEMPDGFKECYGRGVFHCLFCHGFEERSCDSAGVLTGGLIQSKQMLMHVIPNAMRLSKHIVLYTNGNETIEADAKSIIPPSSASHITTDSRVITNLALVNDGPKVKITFADGTSKTEGFVASHPNVEHHEPSLAKQLGLDVGPMMDIKLNGPFNATNVPGVFAGGDAATPMRNVMQALHMGGFAGAGCVSSLQQDMLRAGTLYYSQKE